MCCHNSLLGEWNESYETPLREDRCKLESGFFRTFSVRWFWSVSSHCNNTSQLTAVSTLYAGSLESQWIPELEGELGISRELILIFHCFYNQAIKILLQRKKTGQLFYMQFIIISYLFICSFSIINLNIQTLPNISEVKCAAQNIFYYEQFPVFLKKRKNFNEPPCNYHLASTLNS